MAGRSSKGSTFERNFSRRLSMWWTGGVHDDWFWRSHGSGGRATQRFARGQETTGYAGDITATHADAYPLLECMSFELKCGYPKVHVADVFDAGPNLKPKWLEFWQQAKDAAEQNGSLGCALITQRTRRQPMMWISQPIAREMKLLMIPLPIRFVLASGENVYGMTVDEWFENVTPEDVLDIIA